MASTIVSSSVSDTNDPGDFADFASRNEDRITTESAPMLAPSDLVQLPKGQAFALIHGGQLHKIRMPLPDASHDPLMPVTHPSARRLPVPIADGFVLQWNNALYWPRHGTDSEPTAAALTMSARSPTRGPASSPLTTPVPPVKSP